MRKGLTCCNTRAWSDEVIFSSSRYIEVDIPGMTPIEEIKSKLAIDQVIGEYVTLKQAGTNFKGLCPFHQEKTPSFMVSPEKQIWHCFGCNEGGDVISFIQKYEGLDFKGATELLAQKAGVVFKGFAAPDQGKKRVLHEIHEHAQSYYEKILHAADDASTKTLAYLASRGLTDQTIREWGLGLAPDSWDALIVHLRSKKFSEADIIASGLAIARDGKVYDRFRRRLLFPICDVQGKVVAFTARTLQYIVYKDEDIAGKYVNSPQTPVYNKSQILYGFDKAKHDTKRLNYAIIVEGNMDAIMSQQAGIKNVVAVSGTALTLDQLKLLGRYTKNIILSFDADTAGSQAVFRGIGLAWQQDMNVKVIILEGSKDPAEIIQKDSELWKQAIKTSIGVVDFYIDAVCARVDLSRADHKKQAVQKIMAIISQLRSRVEQEHYITILSRRLGVSTETLWALVANPQRGDVAEEIAKAEHASPMVVSQHLLAFITAHPQHCTFVFDQIEPEMLSGELQDLYKKIIVSYTKGQSYNPRAFASELSAVELSLWSELVFLAERLYESLLLQDQERERAYLTRRIRQMFLSQRLKELTEAIRSAERIGDAALVDSLLRQHQEVSARRSL